jgi:hypothetical protein
MMGETKEVRLPDRPDGRVQTVQNKDKSLGKTYATTKFHQPKELTCYELPFLQQDHQPSCSDSCRGVSISDAPSCRFPSLFHQTHDEFFHCAPGPSHESFRTIHQLLEPSIIHFETYYRILIRTVYLQYGRLDFIAVVPDRQLCRRRDQRCIRIVLRAKSGAGLAQSRHSR